MKKQLWSILGLKLHFKGHAVAQVDGCGVQSGIWGRLLSEYFSFPVSIIVPMLRTHILFTYHWHLIVLAVDIIVK